MSWSRPAARGTTDTVASPIRLPTTTSCSCIVVFLAVATSTVIGPAARPPPNPTHPPNPPPTPPPAALLRAATCAIAALTAGTPALLAVGRLIAGRLRLVPVGQ